MTHEMPKAFGEVGWVVIDEDPTDAFLFGTDPLKPVTLELDALRMEPPVEFDKVSVLMLGREALYHALHQMLLPINPHRGVPVSRQSLHDFIIVKDGVRDYFTKYDASQLQKLEWRAKVEPDIRPNMTEKQVREEVVKAAGNATVKKIATLWELIEAMNKSEDERCGRIQIHRGGEGRFIRMVGLREVGKDWGNIPTLICDATGNFELLQTIWPDLITDETVQGWQQLPRPKSVRVFQIIDRSKSKWDVAVEGRNPKELERKINAARRMYGSVLCAALPYGGDGTSETPDVGLITYKSTRAWVEACCYVPPWLRILHFGDITGTNILQHVAAKFQVGRPMASGEDVTRQAEALFGGYIATRDFKRRNKAGRIPIVRDAAGNNTVRVDVLRHQHPRGEQVSRQICEAGLIQAEGRARAGLRGDDEPLDIFRSTDVPLPELGPVVPQLWSEVDAGLDGLMLATSGIWLECVPDAVQAFPGFFSVAGLTKARSRGSTTSPIRYTIRKVAAPRSLTLLRYQRAGKGQRPAQATALMGPTAAKKWLEERLGPLVVFEVVEPGAGARSQGRAARQKPRS